MSDDGVRAVPGSLLARVDAAPPFEAIEVAYGELVARVGASDVSVLVLDYSGRGVVRFTRSTTAATGGWHEPTDTVALAGTVYERVLRTQRTHADGTRVTAPVTVRGDAIGVLELETPEVPDAGTLAEIATVGQVLGYAIIANRRYTDLFECGPRTAPFTLAAEIQRRLLPSAFSCTGEQFGLAAWLEPASTVGGDTFDYSVERTTLHLSVTDAVGNDVNAAMLATVLVSALRNARRRGTGLAEQAAVANDALHAHSPVGQFVTGQLMRIDLRTGAAVVVNAGHPFPLRLRDGKVEEIELEIDLPFGVRAGTEYRLQTLTLAPGDRLILLTDGVLDRNSAHVDVPSVLGRTAHLHPRDLVMELSDAVIRATGGELKDDSTVLCLDWHG